MLVNIIICINIHCGVRMQNYKAADMLKVFLIISFINVYNYRQQEITLQLLESQALGTSSAFYLCPDTTTATATAAPVTTSQPAAHLMHTSLLVPPANPGTTPAGPSGISVLPSAIPPAPTLPTSVPSQSVSCAAEADAIAMQAEALVSGTNKYILYLKNFKMYFTLYNLLCVAYFQFFHF